VRYGVSTPAAAFISLLGVADRSAALILGAKFDESGEMASLRAVSSWMETIDLDELFPVSLHHLRAELLRRQAFRSGRDEVPYEFVGFRGERGLAPGVPVSLQLVGNHVKILHDGRSVGEITQEDASVIIELLRKKITFSSQIAQPPKSGNLGYVFVMRDR
jgi:hypothetical protein